MAAVTNYQNLRDLKQHSLISCEGQKSHMLLIGIKPRVSGLHAFLEALRENIFPCPFQLLEAACISWLLVPFLRTQRQQWWV